MCHLTWCVATAMCTQPPPPLSFEFVSGACLVGDSRGMCVQFEALRWEIVGDDWGSIGDCWGMRAGPLPTEFTSAAYLVGDSRGMCAHFEALRWEIPVGAGPLAGQLHASALVLLHNLTKPKVLYSAQGGACELARTTRKERKRRHLLV